MEKPVPNIVDQCRTHLRNIPMEYDIYQKTLKDIINVYSYYLPKKTPILADMDVTLPPNELI